VQACWNYSINGANTENDILKTSKHVIKFNAILSRKNEIHRSKKNPFRFQPRFFKKRLICFVNDLKKRLIS